VQQHPLVDVAESEQVAYFHTREPFDVSEYDHLTLTRGKAIERGAERPGP
jgi:hypothetical protein